MSAADRRCINCPRREPCASCPLDYEKIEHFKNIGLVIYNRIAGAKHDDQSKIVADATKRVIVQNIGDEPITSADLMQEIEKQDMSCPKCRQIVDLVCNLLKNVPALDKEASMGICDKCTFQVPCLDCKDQTMKLLQNVDAEKENYRQQVKDWENKLKMQAEESFKEWFNKRPLRLEPQQSEYEYKLEKKYLHQERVKGDKQLNVHGIVRPSRTQVPEKKNKHVAKPPTHELRTTDSPKSDSGLRIDQLLRREYRKAARELDISDLIQSPIQRSTEKTSKRPEHALPYIISPKSSISSRDSDSLTFGDLPAKVMASARKADLQLEDRVLPREDASKASIITFEKKSTKTWPKDEKQSKRYKNEDVSQMDENIHPKRKGFSQRRRDISSKSEDILPTPWYAHNKEKYEEYMEDEQATYHDDLSQRTKQVRKKTKRTKDALKKISDEDLYRKLISDRESYDDLRGERYNDERYISKRSLKFPKVKQSQREFSFSFPSQPLKPREVFRDKSSSELIKDTHEMLQARTEELIRKIEEKRFQSAQKLEAKQLAKEEKTRLAEEKWQEAEDRKFDQDEKRLMDRIDHKLQQGLEKRDDEQETGSKDEELTPDQGTKESRIGKTGSKSFSPLSKKKTPSKTSVSSVQKQKAGADTHIKPDGTKEPGMPKTDFEFTNKLKDEINEVAGKPKDDTKLHKGSQKDEAKEVTGKPKDTKETEKYTAVTEEKAKVKISSDNGKVKKEKGDKKSFKYGRKTMESTSGEKVKKVAEPKKKKEVWKIKMLDEKPKALDVKLGKAGKIPNKPKELLERGLADILKGKNVFQRRDITQITRARDRIQDKAPSKEPKEKKAKFQKFKMRRSSTDIKPLVVKFKRGLIQPDYKYKGKILRNLFGAHETKHKVIKDPMCPFCMSSELEFGFEITKPAKYQTLPTEFIKGQKIIDGTLASHDCKEEMQPILFKTQYEIPTLVHENQAKKTSEAPKQTSAVSSAKSVAKLQQNKPVDTSGVIRYVLSDRSFIDKGWTMLPTEKVMRKMNVYRMRPAKPEFDWFKRNKNKRQMYYDSGEPLAQLDEDDRCQWFYKNGRVALDYYNAEEQNAQQRFIIYSNGEPDEGGRPRPYTILAMFDYLGNGIVFDHGGKIRLKYNQTEGIVLDKNIGPVSHWKWHTLNDPPQFQQVMIDTHLAHKDPHILSMNPDETNHQTRLVSEDMVAVEFENYFKEKSKTLARKFKPFQIRVKAMKINEHFSLKILDQASVYLIYREGTTNIKLNIGMLLDHTEIVDTDTAEVGIVSSNVERFPAITESLAAIQKNIARAKSIDKWRMERELRLQRPEPSASIDQLKAAIGRPLRLPLREINSSSTRSNSTTPKNASICDCITGKPSYNPLLS